MATTVKKLKALSQETARAITKNPDAWKKFLNILPNTSVYTFEDELLIYAQAPQATAVAHFNTWKKTLMRPVRNGSAGIGLIRGKNGFEKVEYVFDITQTVERGYSRYPNIWKRTTENEGKIKDCLKELTDFADEDESIPKVLERIIDEETEKRLEDLVRECIKDAEDTYLEGYDQIELQPRIRDLLKNSVFYVVLLKCGYLPEEYLEEEVFRHISEFNEVKILKHLGYAVSEINHLILHHVTRTLYTKQEMVEGLVLPDKKDVPNFGTPDVTLLKENVPNFGTQEEILKETDENHILRSPTGLVELVEEIQLAEDEYVQLDFFPPEELQAEQIQLALAEETEQKSDLFILDSEINMMLRFGSGERNSQYHIAARLLKRVRLPQFTDFLIREYGTGGRGTYINDRKLSMWYDRDGIRFARGATARYEYDRMISWEEAAERIMEMYQQGEYLPNSVFVDALDVTKKEYATNLELLLRDAKKLPEDFRHEKEWGDVLFRAFEDDIARIRIMECFRQISEEPILPWYLRRNNTEYQKVFNEVVLGEGYYKVQAQDIFLPEQQFITEDEIDSVLSEYYSVSGMKQGIAKYFDEHKNVSNRVEYVKNAYGTGGRRPGIPGVWESDEEHSAKGITLQKVACPKVHLTWTNVVARIDRLIKEKHYLKEQQTEISEEAKETANIIESVENPQPELVEELERAKTLIEDYCQNEFDQEADFSELSQIGIAYTTVTDEEIPLQAYANLESYAIERYLEDVLIERRIYNSLESLIIEELEDLQFDDLASISDDELALYQQQRKAVSEEIQISEKPLPAENFRIRKENLGEGSPREKYRRNVDAIRLLKELEKDGRQADSFEQEVLAEYVGWGGLSEVFDENKTSWSKEYVELKELLTKEEYNAARESVLNAYYTQPIVIESIYKVLGQMGFRRGNVLEPSMGVGNFFGVMPKSMRASKLYGVELDSISGRIARQLYPNAKIQITGYEKSTYPNDFFDVAVGNVPFGNYQIYDKKYEKEHFLIHDYFLAKTLDQLRTGGVMAFITSKGTMDKKNSAVRAYLAQRAELIGAIRLPNNTFKANAGTEVTSDILFFQKRDAISYETPEWVNIGSNADGIELNQYFVTHPEMVLGQMEEVTGPYGMETTCSPLEGEDLREQLAQAIQYIHGKSLAVLSESMEEEEVLPANPEVRDYSYTVVDDKIYYRENSKMVLKELSKTAEERVRGLIEIRDSTRQLIALQSNEEAEEKILEEQKRLNTLYDRFYETYGVVNAESNRRVFAEDSSYPLLCSLEILDEDGNLKRKADMFSKRTISRFVPVTHVDTAVEALTVAMGERAKVDLSFMADLTDQSEETVAEELKGVIFLNPETGSWENNDEYLSGNVREKLRIAKLYAQSEEKYQINVSALEKVQPKDLDASEIEVRIGTTWLNPEIYKQFMEDVFHTPLYYLKYDKIRVDYSPSTGNWRILGKRVDAESNTLVYNTYGTKRMNAYEILETTLNLKDARVYDRVEVDGTVKSMLNKAETMYAAQRQDAMKEAFQNWVYQNPERRQEICKEYNERFNSIRPREYDGSHLTFPGMNTEIQLKPHQKNAVAHQLYGKNTLLAHCVGAGKTFEMVAAAMESKRLGLCKKSMFVVPNHLTEQWGAEFLQLYPGANILVATKKDFEKSRRKKFCARIATGDYDAVIIGHSQFERIPLSNERLKKMLDAQINEVVDAIAVAKEQKAEKFTIKQLEKTRKQLTTKLEKLNQSIQKDDTVNFEDLGIDRLFVDESHSFKNLFLYTKMRNVAGVAQTEALKSTDMFNKCQYINEINHGKGVTFATGTPVSNSMTELFTIQRYLQMDKLRELGLTQFDAWASTFGETVTAIELAPEGTGYRAKTRFAKFFNVPELMSIFKEVADIQTADMLNLPVPEVEYENIVIKPTEEQKEMIHELSERADRIRNGAVDAAEDNMLKITNDGRKLALDQRLIDESYPAAVDGKVAECARKCFEIWAETKEKQSAQLVFCDQSTPKKDGTFNVYDDLKERLIHMGVPEKEIAYIHDANTDAKKAELFSKVRSGKVRFLFGSTPKMGAGTNVQDKLIALHHLDVPWKPSDIEQQEGRILRQGNQNEKVKIFRYVTESTFDSYMWQLIENKQKFIGQIMTSKAPVRSCEDVDDAALSYAEIKALSTGNPHIREKMELDIEVAKLKVLKANYNANIYRLEDQITHGYPTKIAAEKAALTYLEQDQKYFLSRKNSMAEQFEMTVEGVRYTEKANAGEAVRAAARQSKKEFREVEIGTYLGFQMAVQYQPLLDSYNLKLRRNMTYEVELGNNGLGNIIRINNALENIPKRIGKVGQKIQMLEAQFADAKEEVTKVFPQEEILQEKMKRLSELDTLLNLDEKVETIALEATVTQSVESSEEQVKEKQLCEKNVPKFGTTLRR